jgi:uncharacterized protein YidB (DUF937 family)
MPKLTDQDQNVFDMMVPSEGNLPSDDDVLSANRWLVIPFVEVLARHLKEGELFGLVDKFETTGTAYKLESWISRAPDLPISENEVQRVLGDAFLDELETKLKGVEPIKSNPRGKLLENISKTLPFIVRKFARTGQIPPQRTLEKYVADIREMLKA